MQTIFICNLYEVYLPFFKDSGDDLRSLDLISPHRIASAAERSYFYLQNVKILVSRQPAPHHDYLKQIGYDTTFLSPLGNGDSICQDLIADLDLQADLLDRLDPAQPVQLIAYCNTPEFYQLVDYLRQQLNLIIETPEAPRADLSWLREALVRKSVFAALAPSLLAGTPCRIPTSTVAEGYAHASAAVAAFLAQGMPCVVKPDAGCLGLGLLRFAPGCNLSLAEIEAKLRSEVGLSHHPMVVEAWIPRGSACQSPSVEVFVPPGGDPYVTYLCDQVFSDANVFTGIALRPEWYESAWAKPLREGALAVAQRLQSLGYCGYFDLDAIVDPAGQVYAVEMNPRRTGGTHVHDMAEFLVGNAYRHHGALLSGALTLRRPCTWPELDLALRQAGLLYPQGTVIPVQTASLAWGVFGYVVMAADWDAVQVWQGQLLDLLT